MRAVHIVLNSFENDSRVLRAATAGLDIFDEVHVYALHDKDLPLHETEKGVGVHRFRLRTRHWSKAAWIQAAKYAELLGRMVASGARLRPSVVHAHDVHGLIIGYCISRLTGARLIYDSHEYWADVQGYRDPPRPFVRAFLAAQSTLSRRSDAVITVCQGIADRLRKEIGLARVDVIRNTPFKWTVANPDLRLRRELGIDEKALLILYQGGVTSGRGVERLLSAFIEAELTDSVLVFMGNGHLADRLRARATESPVRDRVYVIDAVRPDVLPCYTSDADVGVLPLEPLCESYNLALPNKLFEYLQGELAVVSSDLPEIARIIAEDGVGCTYPHDSTDALAGILERLAANPQLVSEYRAAAARCRERYCWENERNSLLDIYRRVLRPS